MVQFTSLDVQFRYRTEGLKKVRELSEAFDNVVKGTKAVDEKTRKIEESISKIRSGVEGLLGTFADPFVKWYGSAKSLYDIYRGLKTKSELGDVSKDKAAIEEEKRQAKQLEIQKRSKILQLRLFKDRFNLFNQDKKISKNLFVYGLSVLGVAGAYALWGPIPSIIFGVATALTAMGLTLNKLSTITKYILPGVIGAVGIYALLNLDSIESFFNSITGGAQQTSQEVQDIWAFGLQTINDSSLQAQLAAIQSVNVMAQGTQGLMQNMTQIAETTVAVQIPKVMEEGAISANETTEKWYNNISNTIGVGSKIIMDEFKAATTQVMVYGKALEGIIDISNKAYSAVEALSKAYSELGRGVGAKAPEISTGSPKLMSRMLARGTTGAMLGAFGGPYAPITMPVGAGVGMLSAIVEDPIARTGPAGLFMKLGMESGLGKAQIESVGKQMMGRDWYNPFGQTGLQSRGGLAIVHEGEEIVSEGNKNVNISLKLNLKATTPTVFTDNELRELARNVSRFRTKELYRRQTTIL